MASETIAQLQSKLQLASAEFQKIQGDLANTVEIRQRLDAQQSENEIVKKVRIALYYHSREKLIVPLQEFSTLASSNVVYKLVGPVLVPQDQTEAKNNVEKRLEFIRGDM